MRTRTQPDTLKSTAVHLTGCFGNETIVVAVHYFFFFTGASTSGLRDMEIWSGAKALDSCVSLIHPARSGSVWDPAQSNAPKQSFVKGDGASTVWISSPATIAACSRAPSTVEPSARDMLYEVRALCDGTHVCVNYWRSGRRTRWGNPSMVFVFLMDFFLL